MNKKFNNFKKEFLQDLSKITDSTKNEIKQKIGLNDALSKQANKTPWFKKIKPLAYSCAFIIVCLIVSITIVTTTLNNKNIPTYQGMFATKIESTKNLSGKRLSGEIEKEIIDGIGVTKLEGISCYENPNTDIIITINILNPKMYEILSFTLNGNKYQSYQFETGSNSTQILVKYQTRDESGIEEITIDEIKYVDGEKIKSARFDGNRTVKIGVTYQNVPSTTKLSDEVINNSYNLSLEIVDKDKIITNDGLYIYLVDGDELVTYKTLTLGINNVSFDELNYSTTYSWFVIGIYDLLDGEGLVANIMCSGEFEIASGYNFGEETLDTTSFSIKLLKKEKFNGKILMAELYQNNEYVKKIDNLGEQVTFDNLLSNTSYHLILTYEFKTNDNKTIKKTMSYDIVTKPKSVPTVQIIDINASSNSIVFNYEITNQDDAKISIKSIELISQDQVVNTLTNLSTLKFANLYTNTNYTIKFNYIYDLNDGEGIHEDSIMENVTTEELEVPSIQTPKAFLVANKIIATVKITDSDSVATVVKLQLYCNDTLVESVELDLDDVKTDGDNYTFSNLSLDKYKLVCICEYDLNDGSGTKQIENILTIDNTRAA